jgi:hyperosmotically inducible protein
MRTRSIATYLILAAFLAPIAALADTDSDRSHPGTFVKDSVITTKVKAKLADEKMSSLMHIDVDTDNRGAVVLSGKAKTQREADRAVSIARGTDGVTSVTSTIVVRADD